MTIDELFDRRVPVAIALALLAQGGAVVWWASAKDSDMHFNQQRIDHVEQSVVEQRNTQSDILQRLARIEERQQEQTALLAIIEKNTNRGRR